VGLGLSDDATHRRTARFLGVVGGWLREDDDVELLDLRARGPLFARELTLELARWLRVLAAGPLLLCLEDLHAADRASVDLLAGALARLREAPIFLVCATRPEASNLEGLLALDPRWGDPATWSLLRGASGPVTPLYLLRAVDLRVGARGIVAVPADEAIFVTLFLRTLWISVIVTLACIVLAYPVAATLAALPERLGAAGLLLVLVPFWTSLLVRTTAWFVLLQREGPLNAAALALGLVEHPLQLIGTRFALLVAMVHVLLPFAILPAYAVMKRLDPALLRAAASLGAPPWQRFLRVHLPLSLPGVASGGAMVFLLSVGFYITPALVGGPRDQMVASLIAFFMNQTVNWGMAAALSLMLLLMAGAAIIAVRSVLPAFQAGR
jgi:putative spermidine/putrescine transport system permease protein